MAIFQTSADLLFAEMKRIDLLLKRAVLIAKQNRPTDVPDDFRGLAVFDREIDALMASDNLLDDPWRMEGETRDAVAAIDAKIRDLRKSLDADIEETIRQGDTPALVRIAAIFSLRPAEVDLLLIALAPELDPRYEQIFGYLQNDVTRRRPSADLALNLLSDSASEKVNARGLLGANAPLLRHSLITLSDEATDRHPSLLRRWLRVQSGVVQYLIAGEPDGTPGATFHPFDHVAQELECSPESKQEMDNLVSTLERTGLDRAVVHITADRPESAVPGARAFSRAILRPAFEGDISYLVQNPTAAALWWRDAVLWDALLIVTHRTGSSDSETPNTAVEEALWNVYETAPAPVIVVGPEFTTGLFPDDVRVYPLNLEAPDSNAQRALWAEALMMHPGDLDVPQLAEAFPMPRASVQRIVSIAEAYASIRNPSAPEITMEDLLRAGRSLSTPRLSQFATSIHPRYTLDDIILPPVQKSQLERLAARMRNRAVVMQEWGFGEKLSRGRGLSILFTGPPGVGKTMAAEVLAHMMNLRLFQIDLASVVSKYIGETTRNLSSIFQEAEMTQSLLFFDEADSLFGKRTESKEALDRYANIEVNYLLQRLEVYEGPVILSTNFQKNLDEAFLRRLHELIEFPMPDEEQRKLIWTRHLPAAAPVDNLDIPYLARQFPLSGGNIRNALLSAAYLAAEDKEHIGMKHVLPSIRMEMQKQGRLVMKSDLASYTITTTAKSEVR